MRSLFKAKVRKNLILLFLIGAPVFIYFSFFVNRGLTLYDEGYIVEASYLVSKGKAVYGDFFFQYTPLSVWLGGLWFKLFGVGILKLRWLGLIFSVATVIVGFLIARRLAGPFAAIITSMALAAWGFPQTNFLWPSGISLFFFLSGLYLIIKYHDTEKEYFLFLSGIALALTFLAKQNLGLAGFVGTTLFILFLRAKRKIKTSVKWYYYGFSLLLLLAIFVVVVQSNSFHGLKRLISLSLAFGKGETVSPFYPILSTPSPGLAGFVKWIAKTYVYDFPVFAYLLGALILIRKKRVDTLWLGTYAASSLYFFAGIWPRVDLAHLSLALPILFIFLVSFWKKKRVLYKFFVLSSLFLFILIGFYKTFFLPYYTFESPYFQQNKPVELYGEKILVDSKHQAIVNSFLNLKKNTLGEDTVFVHPFAPMLYFIIDKDPPVYELYTVDGFLQDKDVTRVFEDIEGKGVRWVLFEIWRDREHTSRISKFIKDNFQKRNQIWDIDVLERI